jgi:hypothetical protein
MPFVGKLVDILGLVRSPTLLAYFVEHGISMPPDIPSVGDLAHLSSHSTKRTMHALEAHVWPSVLPTDVQTNVQLITPSYTNLHNTASVPWSNFVMKTGLRMQPIAKADQSARTEETQ